MNAQNDPVLQKTALDSEPLPGHSARIAKAAAGYFGEPVLKMTAPGGRTRSSFRLFFKDQTIIGTYRPQKARRRREIDFLQALDGARAPVPDLLGVTEEGVVFQSDAGNIRLPSELLRRDGPARDDLIAATFESLWRIKAAVAKNGFIQNAPAIASNAEWLGEFGNGLHTLSGALGIPVPSMDFNGLAQSIATLPTTFVKWDARPGNAAIGPDGTPIWFDWEHYGRRGGAEDFAFVIADETWPVPPSDTLRIFAETCPKHLLRHVGLLRRFAVLQIVARLNLMLGEIRKHGWQKEDITRRYDLVGRDPDLVMRMCAHGASLAEEDVLTRPAVRWFAKISNPDLWL